MTPVLLFVNAGADEVRRARRTACRRRCCSSTATRRPAQCRRGRPPLPARGAHGAGLRFARLRGSFPRRTSPAARRPRRRATAGPERSSIGLGFHASVPCPVVLSGGLNPANVTDGRAARPALGR
ncbi:MAG: hypothetical protein MZW92_24500 [Comamonadaceae bacterium]|nr:hypothetical protein [Comamonadaceae bacterium]